MKFTFLSSIVGVLSAAVCSAPLAAQESPSRPSNVVIIFADDLGYADVGCFGAKGYKTPNIDRLAAEGVRFTDFYVAQAVCSASRTALLTGCYPNRVGILGSLGPNAQHGIHADERTIAEVLKSRGYATAIYGKWHLGHHEQFLPTRHGFDDYFGLPYSNDMWPNHPTSKFPDLPLIAGEKTIELNPDQTLANSAMRRLASRCFSKSCQRRMLGLIPSGQACPLRRIVFLPLRIVRS